LLRDLSVAYAYVKLRNETVTEIHRNLLRVTALNKYIVHLPYVNAKSLSNMLSFDCFEKLTLEKDYLPLA